MPTWKPEDRAVRTNGVGSGSKEQTEAGECAVKTHRLQMRGEATKG